MKDRRNMIEELQFSMNILLFRIHDPDSEVLLFIYNVHNIQKRNMRTKYELLTHNLLYIYKYNFHVLILFSKEQSKILLLLI